LLQIEKSKLFFINDLKNVRSESMKLNGPAILFCEISNINCGRIEIPEMNPDYEVDK
jgi:hypothetical protein